MEILNNEPEEQQEENEILTLTDENGNDVDFEYLDCMEYQGKEYLVLMPADEAVLDAVYDMFKDKYKDVLTFED